MSYKSSSESKGVCLRQREAVKQFPLSQRGRRQRRQGVVLPIEEGPDLTGLSIKWQAASFFYDATLPDNPGTVAAAPFGNGELIGTASTVHCFTVFHAALRRHDR